MRRSFFLIAFALGAWGCADTAPLLERDAPDREQDRREIFTEWKAVSLSGDVKDSTDRDSEQSENAGESVLPEALLALDRSEESETLIQPVEGKITPPSITGSAAPALEIKPSKPMGRPKPGRLTGDEAPVAAAAPVALNDPDADIKAPEASSSTPASPDTVQQPIDNPKSVQLSRSFTPAEWAEMERFVTSVNAYRAENGLSPLKLSVDLSAVADKHVRYLADIEEVSSRDENGQGIGVRLVNNEYLARLAGSLVAGGFQEYDSAMESWKTNRVQRSRLLLRQASEIGVAKFQDRQSKYFTYIEVIVADRS